MAKSGVFSGSDFSIFRLNAEIYSANLHINLNMGKYGPEKTPDSDISHAVVFAVLVLTYCVNTFHLRGFFTM